jgi:DNA repair protein RadD
MSGDAAAGACRVKALRPYQQHIVDGCRAAFRAGQRTTLVQLATGGGKTVLGSFMVQGSSERGLCCWWLVHRRELLMQASRTFHELGIPHGFVAGGRSSDPGMRVQIGSVQTVARRLDRLPQPDLIVFDEAHHLGAAQWQTVFDAFPAAKVIGLTATPWRLDGKGLGNWFETMVQGPTVADLMEAGSLSRYRLFAPSAPDTSAVATAMGDFKVRDLAAVMDKPSITGDAVQHYRQLAHGKRAVVFACSIEHSRNVVAQFHAAGITAEHVDGQMGHDERDAAVARFAAGETLILSNADLLGEGFDVPAIEAAILLRPTQSLSLHLQQVGRALRPAPGKGDAIILDHAGNSIRHGLPDDDREWSLADREKRKKAAPSDVSVRQCVKCFRVYRPAPACPGCGFEAATAAREVEQRDGVLAEIDPAVLRAARKQEERRASTVADLIELGRQRGYKNPAAWAAKYHAARQGARGRYYGAAA